MSAWAIVGLSILSIAFTLIMNAVILSWWVGKRVAKYDAFGEQMEKDHASLEKLREQFAAFTGVVNGVKYRKEET